MKSLIIALFAVALSANAQADQLVISSGYQAGAHSASLTANSDSALMKEVIGYYIHAGATFTAGTVIDTYTFPQTIAEESISDGKKDGAEVYDPPRYTWNFTIPYSKLIQLGGSETGMMIRFGGVSAKTLVRGMKKTLEPSMEILDPKTKKVIGHGYSGEKVACEEKKVKTITEAQCSFHVTK